MSILETFYILFKSDASDVQKGADQAKKSTDKLNESLKSTDALSKKVGSSFLAAATGFATVVASAISVGAIIGGIKSATAYAIELGQASRMLGVNAEELDAWGNAVQRAGGTAAGFQQSLRSLSEHLGTNAQVSLKVLPQLADVFQKLGRTRAFQYGKMLGLDQPTILLLQQGRREVEAVIARQRELGLVTEHDTKIALEFNNAVADTGHAFRTFYNALALTVLPVLTKVLNAIIPIILYLKEHKDLVVGALIAISVAAAAVALPFLITHAAVIALSAAIGGLIALFALIFEDIKYFLEGNESMIGDIIQRWPLVGAIVSDVINHWKMLFQGLLGTIDLAVKAFEKISDLFGQGSKKLTATIEYGKNLLGIAETSPIASQTSTSIINGNRAFNRSNSVTTGPITINTQATDATGIASALGKGLNEQMWQSNSNFDDGVIA